MGLRSELCAGYPSDSTLTLANHIVMDPAVVCSSLELSVVLQNCIQQKMFKFHHVFSGLHPILHLSTNHQLHPCSSKATPPYCILSFYPGDKTSKDDVRILWLSRLLQLGKRMTHSRSHKNKSLHPGFYEESESVAALLSFSYSLSLSFIFLLSSNSV